MGENVTVGDGVGRGIAVAVGVGSGVGAGVGCAVGTGVGAEVGCATGGITVAWQALKTSNKVKRGNLEYIEYLDVKAISEIRRNGEPLEINLPAHVDTLP